MERPQRPGDEGSPELGDVARDAIEHARVIVSDSIAIGKLEAKRALGRVEQMTRDVAPRVVVAAAAILLGLTGVVLGLIAIFIALGEVIPSVAVRLALYAAVFLVLAAIGGFAAGSRKLSPDFSSADGSATRVEPRRPP